MGRGDHYCYQKYHSPYEVANFPEHGLVFPPGNGWGRFGGGCTVSKITSYILYLYRLHRTCCIDTEYNLQILIWIYTDSFLYQQILSSIDTAYMICQLLLTVSTVKMFSSMNGCQMYLQMYLLCCLLATFIA